VNEESGVRYSLNGVDFQEGDLFDNLAAGSYTITVLNNFDCKDSQAVVIGSGSLPVIEKIESLPAGCGEENGGILFEISGGTGLITPLIDKDAFVFGNSFQDLAPGDYVVTFTDEAGCMVSSTINVVQLPCSIYVPNVFSPNGDGINDLFQINTRPGLNGRISTYMIFDRWGTPLYKAQEFSIDSSSQWWDGTYKNKKVATGIYLYYLEVEFEKGERETLQGTVQVVH
jgi:gliding motility-associated-like protein